MPIVTRSARRSAKWIRAFSVEHRQTGEMALSTCVRKIGLRTSFRCSVTAKAAAGRPRRPRTIRVDTSRATRGRFYGASGDSSPRTSTNGSAYSRTHEGTVYGAAIRTGVLCMPVRLKSPVERLARFQPANQHERLRVLAAARSPEELSVGAKRALGARVRVLAPLGLVAGEGGELALDRLADVDEPVGDEPVAARRRPLRARGGRVGEHTAHRVPRDRPGGDHDRVEEGH